MIEASNVRPVSPPATGEVPGHHQAARAAMAAARLRYVALNRMVGAVPESFARDFLGSLFGDAALWSAEERTGFFDALAAGPAVCSFAMVLAALDALDNGDRARASDRARAAAIRLPNDLFIQELERRAAGEAAPDLTGRFCRAPFESIETAPGGDVHFCCPAWLPVPIGNLNQASPEAIWNSPAAQAIRASIHDGSYRYCSRKHCAHLSTDRLPQTGALTHPRLRAAAEEGRTRLDSRPEKLVLAHDRSCTLACPSCRTGVITANAAEAAGLNQMADAVLLPLARDARRVRVTASGDPFGSRHFRYLLAGLTRRDHPRLRLEIQTNGVLFTPAAWREFDLAGRLSLAAISLDAADPDTYALVRRGGSFRRLLANLAFLGERRRAGEIDQLRIDFVVQATNFREMPRLVALGRDFACDAVKFQMIRNWNTWTPAEFARHDIGSPRHPDYPALLRVLRNPAFEGAPVEFWGMAGALADARALVDSTIRQ